MRVGVRDDSVLDTVWGQATPGVFPCLRSKPVMRRPSQFHPSLCVECRGNIYLENGIGGSIRAALAAAAHPRTLSTQDLRKSCESAKGRSVTPTWRPLLDKGVVAEGFTRPLSRQNHTPFNPCLARRMVPRRCSMHPICPDRSRRPPPLLPAKQDLWEIRPSGSFLVFPTLGQLRACLPSCVGCVCAARGSWPSCPEPSELLAPRLCVWNPWKGSLPTRRARNDGDVNVRILHLCRAWIRLTGGNQALSRQQRRAAMPHKDTHLRGPGLRLEAASPLCLFTPPRHL